MTKVKPTVWSISDDVATLKTVQIRGEIHDTHGCFTICHTYQSRPDDQNKTLDFPFYLHDYGLVTGFKVTIAGTEVNAGVFGKSDVPKPIHELIKKHYDASATDSFVCRVTDVPPDTAIQIIVSFVQNLHMEGVRSLGCVIPTVLAPKHYSSEETAKIHQPFAQALTHYELDLDIDLYLRMGAVSTVSSPSHPVSYAPTNDNSGKIRLLPTAKELLDLDLVLRVNTKEPIESLLPACYVEKQEGSDEEIVMVSTIPSYKSTKFHELKNAEEGHPDPREVLFLVDPQQSTLAEVRVVLNEILNQIDAQIFINVFILGLAEDKPLFFNKSLEATLPNIQRARDILNSELFQTKFQEAQLSPNTLAKNLEPIYRMDCVAEEIPRIIFLLSRAHVSHPVELIELVKKNPQPVIFSFGLGVDSNYALLKTLSRYSNGECEIVYCENGEERLTEMTYKISRQLSRIIKPEHEDVQIDWGELNAFMLSQTPSETLKYIHFNTGDIFTFFALCKKVPDRSFEIGLSYKFDPTVEKKKQELKALCEPSKNRVHRKRLSLFQMLGEREQPDDSSVRQKKIAEKMHRCGAGSAYTSFVASNEKVPGIPNCTVTLISATDSLELESQENQKKHIKYTSAALLKFQAFHTAKPDGVDLGEVEKGSEMKKAGFSRTTFTKGPISTRGRGNQSAQTRTKKLIIDVPWDKTKSEEFYKTINSLLNKMSKDNFETLKDKLLAMRGQIENDLSTLEVIVKLIYEKALAAPRFAHLYADLSQVLSRELNKLEFVVDGKPVVKDFKVAILDHCKQNFQSCFVTPAAVEGETADDKAEKEFKRKLRLSCNITFIGELYIRQLLRPAIVHLVIRALLEENRDGDLGKPETQQLELCVKLLTTIEGFKAYPDELDKSERYFDHLLMLSEDTSYDMRIRYLIKDILDLRNKNWEDEKKKKRNAEQQKAIEAANALKSSSELTSSGGHTPKGDRGRYNRDNRDNNRGRGKDDRGGKGGGGFFERQRNENQSSGGHYGNDRNERGGRTPRGGRDERPGGAGRGEGRGYDNQQGNRGGYQGGNKNQPQSQNQPQEEQKDADGWVVQSKGGKGQKGGGGRNYNDSSNKNPHQQGAHSPSPSQPSTQNAQPTGQAKPKPWDKKPDTSKESTTNMFSQLANNSTPNSPTKQGGKPGQQQGGNKQGQGQQGKPGQQPQGKQAPVEQPQPVAPAKERVLKLAQDVLDKRVHNMLEEYVSEQDIPEAIEYIEKIVQEAGDVSFVLASVITRCYNYRKPKDLECCNKLIKSIVTEHKKLADDEDLAATIAVAFPIADELSLDAPNISKQFGLTLSDLVQLNRVTIEKICAILIAQKESGFALKVVLETANSLISIDNGKALVDKIDFREVATARDTKNFETFAKKYPQLTGVLS